ncbi:MAG: hypothetical protein R6X32_10990 [Chloroflexota bacterium]
MTPQPSIATVAPTATSSPTVAATPAADMPATIMYQSPQGAYRLSHPPGWSSRPSLFFTAFASSETLLDMSEEVGDGGLVIVVAGRTSDFGSSDPQTILQTGLTRASPVQDVAFVTGPDAIAIGPQEAAEAELRGSSDTGEPLAAYAVAVVYEERALVLVGITAAATAADYLPIFRDVAASVRLAGAFDEESEADVAEADAVLPLTPVGEVGPAQWVTGAVVSEEEAAWLLTAVSGQTIDILVEPEPGFDAVVDVRNAQGRSLLPDGPVDNSFGAERVRRVAIPTDGETFLVVAGYGSSSGSYEIYMTPSGVVSGPVAGDLAYGQMARGRLETAAALDLWRFSGRAGDLFDVTVRPLPDDLDVLVDVIDPTGLSILPNGAVDEYYDTEYVRGAVLPHDGEYLVLVQGFAGSTGPYEVELGLSHDGPYSHSRFAAHTLPAGSSRDYPFTAAAGDLLTIFVNPDFDFDVVVRIFAAGESSHLLEVDERFGLEMFTWTAPEAGDYFVQVAGYDADLPGGYELVTIGDRTVQFRLLPEDWLIVDLAVGETAVYPLTISSRQRLRIHSESPNQSPPPRLRLLTADGSTAVEGSGHLHVALSEGDYQLEIGPVNGRFRLWLDKE